MGRAIFCFFISAWFAISPVTSFLADFGLIAPVENGAVTNNLSINLGLFYISFWMLVSGVSWLKHNRMHNRYSLFLMLTAWPILFYGVYVAEEKAVLLFIILGVLSYGVGLMMYFKNKGVIND
jgi:uncharacterized membrane protein YfcA